MNDSEGFVSQVRAGPSDPSSALWEKSTHTPSSSPWDSRERRWLLPHPVLIADPGREREVPAVLLSRLLPLVEKRGEGREGPWSWGDSALLSSTPRGHLGKEPSVEYPKERR